MGRRAWRWDMLRKTTRREKRELKRLTTTSSRSLAMWGSALRLMRAVPALNRLVKHATLVIYTNMLNKVL